MRTQIVALVAVLATCAPVHAAPQPQITDPSNDAIALGSSYDIVSALFGTTGTKAKVRGRWVYTPSKLTVTVTYAGKVASDTYAAQVVEFEVPECNTVYLEVYSGGTYGAADCVADAFQFSAKASGKTLTFTLPFAAVGKSYLGPGVELSELKTWTNVADPELGYEPGDLASTIATVDLATTTKKYTVH